MLEPMGYSAEPNNDPAELAGWATFGVGPTHTFVWVANAN